MLRLYIVTLLASAAFTLDITCKDEVKIETQPVQNADFIIGNWSYVYHWISLDELSKIAEKSILEMLPSVGALSCPEIEILPVEPEFVKEKMNKCGDKVKVNWADAKLKFIAPLLDIEDGIVSLGKKENWMMVGCEVIRLEAKMVSNDVVVIMNPVDYTSEMLSRKPLKASEVECLARNIDLGKHMDGLIMCY